MPGAEIGGDGHIGDSGFLRQLAQCSGAGIFAPHIVVNRLICAALRIGKIPGQIGTFAPSFFVR